VQSDRDFADVFDAAHAKLRAAIDSACSGGGRWETKVVAAVAAMLDLAAADPATVRLLTAGVFDYGVYGALRYRRMVDGIASQLALGRKLEQASPDLPGLIEEALIGGVAEIVAGRLRSEREAELPALAGELSQLLLTPYVGAAEARRIIAEKWPT
jgi:hypothetical protein